MVKKRADLLLVERGLAPSREKAKALIMAGEVYLKDRRIEKPGELVSEEKEIFVKEHIPYVSRGGFKLAHALDHFRVDVKGKVALDAGASTGGFTDVLLQRGAELVYAVDVGAGQLDWKLKNDPRVVVMDRTNVRYINNLEFEILPQIATLDLSFISLTLVIDAVASVLTDKKEMILLIKPQFEVGKEKVGRGGIVRNENFRLEAVEKVLSFAKSRGFIVEGWVESPVKGQKGNVEYLAYIHHI